jgi:molybdopterin synthase sulfur carrier subunit
MATVYIPSLLQRVAAGHRQVEVAGATVRELIDNLERLHPGMRDSLLEDNRLRSNISVAIDGEVSPLGLLEKVGASSEVHFVAAIKGGADHRAAFGDGCARVKRVHRAMIAR